MPVRCCTTVHVYDAVVIGAGLLASYHLRRLGIDHVSSRRRRGMGSMPQGRPCRQPGSPTAQVPLWVAHFVARFVTLDRGSMNFQDFIFYELR